MNNQENPPITIARIHTARSSNTLYESAGAQIPLAVAYPDPDARSMNGQLFTARGTTPYAQQVFGTHSTIVNAQLFTARGTTPYAQPVIEIQPRTVNAQLLTVRGTNQYSQPAIIETSNNSITNTVPRDNLSQTSTRPKPPIRIFRSVMPSYITQNRPARVFITAEAVTARESAEGHQCCAKACILITCVLCILIPAMSAMAAMRKNTTSTCTHMHVYILHK